MIGCLLLLVIHPKGYFIMLGVACALAVILLPYGMLTVLLSVSIQRHPMVTAGLGIALLCAIVALTVLPAYFIIGGLMVIWLPIVYLLINVFLFRFVRTRLAEVTGHHKGQLARDM